MRERVADPRLRKWQGELLERMPPSVRGRAEEVEERFRKDWVAVREGWRKHCAQAAEGGDLEERDRLAFFDFVLGWLNVNTRCVYFDVGGPKANNMTLAPVIDMVRSYY